jgi:hypothetical protein
MIIRLHFDETDTSLMVTSEEVAGRDEARDSFAWAEMIDAGVSEHESTMESTLTCEEARARAKGHDAASTRLIELLKQPIASHERIKIDRRVRELTTLFGALDASQRETFRTRLSDSADPLGQLFTCELSRPLRNRLSRMLEQPSTEPAAMTPPDAPSSCRRDIGSVSALVPWERRFLALANHRTEADFQSLAILVGPIILPGIMSEVHRIIVETALRNDFAITIESNVWFPRAIDTSTLQDLSWLVHESVHVLDYAAAGLDAFLSGYIGKAIVAGFNHDEHPDERRANIVQQATNGLFERFPELLRVIRSCDDDAIEETLQSQHDVYRRTINELLGVQTVAPPPSTILHSEMVERDFQKHKSGRAGAMPWDIATDPEDTSVEARTEDEDSWTSAIKKLLTKGYWSAAVAMAIISGERDKNKITNMLFWARHPELDGQKIPKGNKTLADEWMAIHRKLVLPQLGPVSPSSVGPTTVPNEQKSVDTLIIDIFNSELQVLTAWGGALTQFQVVMNAHADAEGVADFVGAVMKHVGEQVISKIAGQVPGVSYAKGMLETVTKEYERARATRTSAQLRDFLVSFTGALTNAMNDLGRGFGDYKHMVETTHAKAGTDEKKQYQKALADHLDSLDRNWTNLNNVFLLICQEWIRNTTFKEHRVAAPAFVRISVNKDYSVRGVELLCPGGQKIAEQLLKNAGGSGLRPHPWPVPRRFLYFVDSSSWPNAFINLTSEGRWAVVGSVAENSGVGSRVLEHIRRNGLPATTNVRGR